MLNVMLGVKYEKDKELPSLTLVELGNAYANSENPYGGLCCAWIIEKCYHPIGIRFDDSWWYGGWDTCP